MSPAARTEDRNPHLNVGQFVPYKPREDGIEAHQDIRKMPEIGNNFPINVDLATR